MSRIQVMATLTVLVALPLTANAQEEAESTLHVRIETDDPKVELFQYHGQSVGHGYAGGGNVTVVTTFYEPICLAPCDKTIANGYPNQYFLGGKGISGTSAFSLSNYDGDVTLQVKAGSAVGKYMGYMLVLLGGTTAMTGGIMLGVDGISSSSGNEDGMSGMKKASIGMLAGGLLAAIPGAALSIQSSTEYSVVQNAPSGTDPSTLARNEDTL